MAVNQTMTSRQRLETVFAGGRPDRTPILSGWIACPRHIATVAGVSLEEYWRNPVDVSLRAYDLLGVDGLIDVFVPKNQDDFRCVDGSTYQRADRGLTLEQCIEQIDAMPSPERIERDFDLEAAYAKLKANLLNMQPRCGRMLWMPAQWNLGAKVVWYQDYGYENFFLLVGLYPDKVRKLLEVGGATGRMLCTAVARLVKEGLYPHAVLTGEDICTQRGPMIDPDFMAKYYAPQLRYSLEPLLEAGCKPVWHCDGDVRPILDMVIDAGVQGLQGFQPECGLTIEYVASKRTRDGKPLLIFGPMAVTTELPVLSAEDVYRRARYAIDTFRGKADLVMFTANTINPDVPLENIQAMYQAAMDG